MRGRRGDGGTQQEALADRYYPQALIWARLALGNHRQIVEPDEVATQALAQACAEWEPERGEFRGLLRILTRKWAAELVGSEMAHRRLQEGLGREIGSHTDRGAQERIAARGLELRGQLAPRLTQGEQQALDLLTVFDGDRGHVCALLGVTKQRLAAIVRQLRGKAIGGVK